MFYSLLDIKRAARSLCKISSALLIEAIHRTVHMGSYGPTHKVITENTAMVSYLETAEWCSENASAVPSNKGPSDQSQSTMTRSATNVLTTRASNLGPNDEVPDEEVRRLTFGFMRRQMGLWRRIIWNERSRIGRLIHDIKATYQVNRLGCQTGLLLIELTIFIKWIKETVIS